MDLRYRTLVATLTCGLLWIREGFNADLLGRFDGSFIGCARLEGGSVNSCKCNNISITNDRRERNRAADDDGCCHGRQGR